MVKFEFLGFSYQPKPAKSKYGQHTFLIFAAIISQSNRKRIREEIRQNKVWTNTTLEMTDIAKSLNAKLRGWINYYSTHGRRTLRITLLKIDQRLIKWLGKKHKIGQRKSSAKLKQIRQANPALLYHWQKGY